METDKQKRSLSCDEVCSILKACGDAQVRVLKFADLYVRFDDVTPNPVAGRLSPHATAEIAGLQKKEATRSLEQAELELREAQLAEMFITDPLRAEELLIQGELEEADGGTTEET